MPNLVTKKSVLIIDDDKLVLRSLSSFFIKNGWSVDICQGGLEGLKRVEERKYDCILLDVRMPGLDGTEVMERLRDLEENKKIDKQKVIIMTGYADESASIKAFQLGAYHYIQKPFDSVNLLEAVTGTLNAAKSLEVFDSPPVEEAEEQTFKKIRKLYEPESVEKKADILSRQLEVPLRHIRGCTYDTNYLKGNIENPIGIVQIPLGIVGPISVHGSHAVGDFWVPMATTEGALVLTYDVGIRLLKISGPVEVEILSKGVHIDPMFPITTDEDRRVNDFVDSSLAMIKQVAEGDSRHCKLLQIKKKRIGNNFVMKFIYDTGDAHGLNMINNATFNACKYIEAKTGCHFYHRSHYSGIKHHSLLNEQEGQGRCVRARAVVSSKALGMLKVTAAVMKDFFDRCMECGAAAGISAVNVHAANGITAIYLATGQDMADLSMSNICATTTEIVSGKDLLIECTLRNLLLGTVGGGTGLGTQSECLKVMGCFGSGKADKFSEIIAATVLAGEFPTAAAVITRTYVDIHNKYGRNKDKIIRD